MKQVVLLFLALVGVFYAQSISPIRNIYYDEDKAKLGKRLFYDVRLSSSGRLSCEYCHNLYWQASGTNKYNINITLDQKLNSPTVLNAALNHLFFFDGREHNMHKQVEVSITDVNQLGSSREFVVERVKSDPYYVDNFYKIYKKYVNFDDIVDAIVNFQKALVTTNSPFDLYLQGNENAITQRQKDGYVIFKTKGCIECHNGINLGSNVLFGSSPKDNDGIRLKIPGLRNVILTAPYMHDGSVANLRQVIKDMNFVYQLKDEEVELIYEFLHSLTGQRPEILNEK